MRIDNDTIGGKWSFEMDCYDAFWLMIASIVIAITLTAGAVSITRALHPQEQAKTPQVVTTKTPEVTDGIL